MTTPLSSTPPLLHLTYSFVMEATLDSITDATALSANISRAIAAQLTSISPDDIAIAISAASLLVTAVITPPSTSVAQVVAAELADLPPANLSVGLDGTKVGSAPQSCALCATAEWCLDCSWAPLLLLQSTSADASNQTITTTSLLLPPRDQLASAASRPAPPPVAPAPILPTLCNVEAADGLEGAESRGHDWGTLAVAAICGAVLCLSLLLVATYCCHSGQKCKRCECKRWAGPGETRRDELEKTAASASIADDHDQPIDHWRVGLVSPREIRQAVCPDGSCQQQPSSNQSASLPCHTPYLPNYRWGGEASVEQGPGGIDEVRSEGELLPENVTERVEDAYPYAHSIATAPQVRAPTGASADEPKQDTCASTSDVRRWHPPAPTAAPTRAMSRRPHSKSAALRPDERAFLPVGPGPIAEPEKRAPRWFIAAPLPPIRDPCEAATVAKAVLAKGANGMAAHNISASSSWACGVLDDGTSPSSKPKHSPTTEASSQGTLSPGQASADLGPRGGSGDAPDACCCPSRGAACARTTTTGVVPHSRSPSVPPLQWEDHPSLSSTSGSGRRRTLRLPFGPIARDPVGNATEHINVDNAASPRYTRHVARATLNHASQQARRTAPSLHHGPLSRGLPVVASRMPHRMMLGQQALKVLPPATPGSCQSAGGSSECAAPFGLRHASAERPFPQASEADRQG